MKLDCESIKSSTKGFELVRGCDQIKNGYLRLETPFRYPDGSQIDLFLGQSSDLLQQLVLTDLGHTTAYLLDLQIRPWTTKKRKQVVEDVCRTLDIQQSGGELRVEFEVSSEPNIADGLVRLAQACIRIADLVFTQRLRTPTAFQEDFEEFLAGTELPYEQELLLPGRFGKEIPIDFRVRGSRVVTLILTLSTANPAASHQIANEVLRKWYDLEPHKASHQFLSIYDSSTDVFREDDLARLNTLSTVFAFPAESEQVRDVIAA